MCYVREVWLSRIFTSSARALSISPFSLSLSRHSRQDYYIFTASDFQHKSRMHWWIPSSNNYYQTHTHASNKIKIKTVRNWEKRRASMQAHSFSSILYFRWQIKEVEERVQKTLIRRIIPYSVFRLTTKSQIGIFCSPVVVVVFLLYSSTFLWNLLNPLYLVGVYVLCTSSKIMFSSSFLNRLSGP